MEARAEIFPKFPQIRKAGQSTFLVVCNVQSSHLLVFTRGYCTEFDSPGHRQTAFGRDFQLHLRGYEMSRAGSGGRSILGQNLSP